MKFPTDPFSAVVGLLDVVPSWVWALLLAGSVLNGCHTEHKLDTALVDKANVVASAAKATTERAEAARLDAEKIADLQTAHTKLQQELSNANAQRAADRAASDRARTAVYDGLRGVVHAYAASGGAEAATDAAACRRDADHAERVGGLLEEALGLQDEGERLIRQRDDEVTRLLEQIRIDREAVEKQ